jgi:hypothetical protein
VSQSSFTGESLATLAQPSKRALASPFGHRLEGQAKVEAAAQDGTVGGIQIDTVLCPAFSLDCRRCGQSAVKTRLMEPVADMSG